MNSVDPDQTAVIKVCIVCYSFCMFKMYVKTTLFKFEHNYIDPNFFSVRVIP